MTRLTVLLILLLTAIGCEPQEGEPDPDPEDGLHGSIEVVDGRDVLRLWGTRYEMGYAEGALYCEGMPTLFKNYVLEYLVADYGVPYEMVQALVENAVELDQGDLDEMQGIFDGALDHCDPGLLVVESDYLEESANGSRELVLEDMIAANILGDWGCSSFTVWGEASATGDTIHARNFDWPIDPTKTFVDQHLVKAYSSDEEGGARYASLTVPGLIGCLSCVSDEGVGFMMHNVSGLDATQSTGIKPRMLAMRSALAATWQQGDPVAPAEAILEAKPQRVGNNLHLSFPTALGGGSGGVVFEYDGASDHPDGQATVRVPGEDPGVTTADGIACTNHYVKRSEPPTSGNSFDRLATLQAGMDAAAGSGGLDVDGALDLIHQVASDEYTAQTVVLDAANREWRVYVSPGSGTPASATDPMVLDLDELFEPLR